MSDTSSDPALAAAPKRRGRPPLSDEERAARAEARRLKAYQGTVSLLTYQTSREDAEGEREFAARDRFDVVAIRPGAVPDVLSAPRPVDWLRAFRCDPAPAPDGRQTRVLAAADHVVLECLISAARARHLSLEHQTASVPVASVLAVVGGAHTEKWLRKCLGRLASTECVLPGLRRPRTRMSLRRRLIVEDPSFLEEDEILEHGMRDILPTVRADARDGSVPPDPRRLRISDAEHLRRIVAREPVDPTPHPEVLLVRDQPPEREFDWFGAPVHVDRRFVPVVRWAISDGEIHFELARWLRHWCNAFRKVDHRRAPWAAVDLRQMASFTSPYTAPLYRRLVAETYDAAARNSLIDEKVVVLPIREVAEICGHRSAGGGLFSEMDRAFLKRVAEDLAGMGGRIEMSWIDASADRASMDRTSLRFRVHAPLDVGRMRSAHVWRLPNGRTETPSREDLAALAPFDRSDLHVSTLVWMKILGRLKLDKEAVMRLSRAWLLAVDEAMHAGRPYFGDLTGFGRQRRMRGSRLADEIRRDVDAACFRFCVEELAEPDLSSVDRLDVLEAENAIEWAAADRRARYLHAENGDEGEPEKAERHLPVGDRELLHKALWKKRRDRQAAADAAFSEERADVRERTEWFRNRRERRHVVDSDDYPLDDFPGRIYLEFGGERWAEPIDLAQLRIDAVRDDRWTDPITTAPELRAYLGRIYAGMAWDVRFVTDKMGEFDVR